MKHREMMYDPQTSCRGFKHAMRLTTAGAEAEQAWAMGIASVQCPGDLPKRWRTNPYRPGRRHDLYEQGRAAMLEERAEFLKVRGRR